MEQPVICVIVPVYKAEATLPRCIESVLTQQLPGGLRPTGACHPQRRYAGISGRQPGRAGGP